MSDFIDLSGRARGQLADRLKHLVEAVAVDLRDEIVRQMDPGPGPRTGREYPMPGRVSVVDDSGARKRGKKRRKKAGGAGTYVASAPGEPPAVREGVYAASWQATPAVQVGSRVVAAATNGLRSEDGEYLLAELLEDGTEDMEPRPHIEPAMVIVAKRWGAKIRRVK